MFYFDNLRNYVPVNGLERGNGNRSSQKYSDGVRVGYKSQDKIHQNLKAFNFQLSSPSDRMNESPQKNSLRLKDFVHREQLTPSRSKCQMLCYLKMGDKKNHIIVP